MPPISQTGIVEPLTVATRHNPTVDPARVATSILTGMSSLTGHGGAFQHGAVEHESLGVEFR
jgi:hypothetical protein